MKAQRNTVKSGAMAYMGIMAQVQAEREAEARAKSNHDALPRVPLAAVWTPRGHEAFNKRGHVEVRYVTRLAPNYTRATFTYII